jgi:tetratricopeptide (TPR) repeat protein
MVLQGKTQLSRALSQGSAREQDAEALKARAYFVEANAELKKAAAALDAQLAQLPEPTTPAEKAERKRLQDQRLRAELDLGLNLFDQALTYTAEDKTEVALARGKKVEEAERALEKVAGGDEGNPVTWQARAWVARCIHQLGKAKEARKRFTDIQAGPPAAAAGKRLARYFWILAFKETPDPDEKKKLTEVVVNEATKWLADYPNYLNTPEGYGVRLELAEALVKESEEPKANKVALLGRARKLLTDIESSENDFTDKARQLKLAIMSKQGGFTKPVTALPTFEDCYVRAQYETVQMGKDGAEIKGADEREAKRKERVATIIAALERGLKMQDAQKAPAERNNARAMLAYYYLNSGQREKAVEVGEGFARTDPRPGQAASAAVYALQAYAQIVAERERKFEDAKAERAKMLDFAKYMEERWPAELAGDLARHQIGLLLMREKNYPEAIRKLATVTPAYPSYAFAQYQVAECAFEADKEKLEPVPGEKRSYRQIALDALRAVPDSAAGEDPATNRVYALAKTRLGRELFREKQYDEMRKLAGDLQERLQRLRLSTDRAQDRSLHEHFQTELTGAKLYGEYGTAEIAFGKGRWAEVAQQLDPVVDQINAGKLPELKQSAQLGMAILSLDLKANVQLNRIDRTQAALKALQGLSAEAGGTEAGVIGILKQLVGLIRGQLDELRRQGDQANFQKAVAGYSAVLDGLIKQQQKPTPEFVFLLARAYAEMEQHGKAAELLEGVPEPKAGAGPNEVKNHHAVRLILARELRLGKELDKAEKVLDEIIGTKEKPGWGARDLEALKERGQLLEAQGKYAAAFNLWASLVRQLVKQANTDNAKKEHYLECYYHMTLCLYKHGQAADGPEKKAKAVKEAAQQIVQVERRWDGFGSDASKKRYTDLLNAEPALKAAYEEIKGTGK